MAQFNSKNESTRVARRWFTDIDVNMTLHPQSKDVVLKTDFNAIKRSVRNLVTTNNYERPFKPNFGANLRGQLFELQGIGAKRKIVGDIKEALYALEPRVRNVRVAIGENNRNNIDVMVQYDIINGLGRDSVDFTVTRVR